MIEKQNAMFEICEMPEDKMAGRIKIRMSAHKIVEKQSLETANENGICWIEEYVNDNIDSCIGMPYVVDWLYSKEEGVPSGHGKQSYTEDGEVVFEGESVGSVIGAKIEDVEIDGVIHRVLMTEGYIYEQRNKALVDFLREQKSIGNTIYGSIEINGKNGSKTIDYLDGNKNSDSSIKMDRVPTKYGYSGLAILYIETPADQCSQVFEINSKQDNLDIYTLSKGGKADNMKLISKGMSVEINNLTSYQIETILEKAFKIATGEIYSGCYISRLYPINSQFIVTKWENGKEEFYMSSYSFDENYKVTLGDIYEVEQTWTPKNNESPLEVNKKGGNETMELQAKYEALEKEMQEKNAKMTELNEALVNANKMMEESNTKVETMSTELNEYKTKFETMEAEKNEAEAEAEKNSKIAEVNAYFETEIAKNGFDESEINSLEKFKDTTDLEGLKVAEAEICTKKIKDLAAKNAELEINSKTDMFIPIVTKEKKVVKDTIPTFFN